MSVLTVQLGQCGNQVGFDWFSALGKDLGFKENEPLSSSKRGEYAEEGLERWFSPVDKEGGHFARCVLVDTEPKAINDICKRQPSQEWKYNPLNIVCRKYGGAGNNWALGYSCRGHEIQEAVMDCIRKEAEKCDKLHCFLSILSSAGGTGSGVGSRVIEELGDEYSSKTLVSAVVLPYESGEVITQNYNTLLTLEKIYDVADMHVVFRNDLLHRMCTKILRKTCVTLKDLNSLVAEQLSFLQPVGSGFQNYLPTMIGQLTPHPGYKLVSVKSSPHPAETSKEWGSEYSWKLLMNHMIRMLRISTFHGTGDSVMNSKLKLPPPGSSPPQPAVKYVRCTANTLVTRGCWDEELLNVEDFSVSEIYPDWIPVDSQFYHYHGNEKWCEKDKFISLITNNSLIHVPLMKIVEKGWNSFAHGAYIHHYSKFEIEEDDLLQAFVKTENVAKCYAELNYC